MSDSKGKPSLLPERLVARLWRNRDWRRPLRTQDGRWVRVLYPGRPGSGPGPDFRDAVVQIEGSPPVRGDVEVHRQAAGWTQHGHHRDPRYNGVVLHVVSRSSRRAASYRQDGRVLPVTELPTEGSPLPGPPEKATPQCGAFARLQGWRNLSGEQLGRLLDQAGERRFLRKSARYRTALGREDAEDLLYRGVLEALGYSRNRKPFLELARRLPWRTVRDVVRTIPPASRELATHRLLLRVAGLSGETPVAAEEACFPLYDRWPGYVALMEPSAWCFAGVRPVNQPRRRMAGAAALLSRYLDTGLLAGLLPLARGESVTALSSALTVADGVITLIGRGRALDMTVNVVLPLLHAWALLRGEPALASSCLRLYRRAPRLAENEITREMAALLQASPRQGGALRQQGLIHLYEVLLKEGMGSEGSPGGASTSGFPVTKSIGEWPGYYGASFSAASPLRVSGMIHLSRIAPAQRERAVG